MALAGNCRLCHTTLTPFVSHRDAMAERVAFDARAILGDRVRKKRQTMGRKTLQCRLPLQSALTSSNRKAEGSHHSRQTRRPITPV